MRTLIRELFRAIATIGAALLVASLVASLGSGFGVDERELDPRFNSESQAAIREAAANQRLGPSRLFIFAKSAMRGDLGVSTSLGKPVSELLLERAPATVPALALAWLLTVGLAVGAALGGSLGRSGAGERVMSGATALALAVPSAVLALLFAWLRLPVTAALVAAVLPQSYRYASGVLAGTAAGLPALAARSRGIGGLRLGLRHILLPAAPELIGVASLTLNLLIGVSIPIEALTGTAGLGHLVWQAALGRDVALIAAMTLVVATGTLLAGSMAEVGATVLRARRAA